jgi:hypothetical protein
MHARPPRARRLPLRNAERWLVGGPAWIACGAVRPRELGGRAGGRGDPAKRRRAEEGPAALGVVGSSDGMRSRGAALLVVRVRVLTLPACLPSPGPPGATRNEHTGDAAASDSRARAVAASWTAPHRHHRGRCGAARSPLLARGQNPPPPIAGFRSAAPRAAMLAARPGLLLHWQPQPQRRAAHRSVDSRRASLPAGAAADRDAAQAAKVRLAAARCLAAPSPC